MKEKIKVGFIGLGRRGSLVLKNNISQMSDVEVTAICDLSQNRMEEARKVILENSGHDPIMTTNYKDIINNPDIDAVIIMIGWSGRPQMAIESIREGKYTTIEVGCAYTLQECYDIVAAYEETGVPVMMLENCCYGRREMMVLNMVKQGLFGEVVHCTGAYGHYLNNAELFYNIGKEEIPHYRLEKYRTMNRENYPTHELGPISKVLNINRGNRFVSLSSFGSKNVGIKSYVAEHFGEESEYYTDYKQSDIVNTFLTCANGETVLLTLDTTLPRAYYTRNFSVHGTKGMSSEERRVVFLDDPANDKEIELENNEEEMFKKYDHPLHEEYIRKGVKEGHGGMDWLVCRAFVEAVKNGTNTPIDAYDTAAWLAIGPLSEQSIANGGAPVEFPDFTNGKWKNREPIVESKYCLDAIVKDESVSVV